MTATIMARFHEHVQATPDRIFMIVEIAGRERQVSFAAAWAEFAACASVLADAAPPGSRVIVFLPQGWDGVAFFFGAMLAGLVPAFMPNPSAKQDADIYWASHRALLDRIDPAVIVTDAAQARAMAANGLLPRGRHMVLETAARPACPAPKLPGDPAQIALLQHSSGTTGTKKGVMLSHRAVLLQVDGYARAIGATAADLTVSWLPLYHDMGLVACLLMPAILGQTVVLLDPFGWVGRPASLFRAVTQYRGTLCWLPNFAFEHLARTVRPGPAFNLGSMRAFINCSEPCQAETFRRFAHAFTGLGVRPDMLQVCYAMAETTFAATQHPAGIANRVLTVDQDALIGQARAVPPSPGARRVDLLSAGPPIAGVEIAIRDATGQDLAPGSVGEICLRTTFLFDGYFRLPEQTAERLIAGWYHTRDRGFVHEGHLYVLGRIDDLLILNGRNFHAAEIEAVLGAVPGLKPGRTVAFGLANAAKGTTDLIVVAETPEPEVADATATRHRARAALFEAIALYPAELLLVPPGWVVKTSSGKIARGANAAKYAARNRAAEQTA